MLSGSECIYKNVLEHCLICNRSNKKIFIAQYSKTLTILSIVFIYKYTEYFLISVQY